MTNLEKYNRIFAETFQMAPEALNDEFSKESAENWDSLRQLSLVTELENSFEILFDTEDILGLDSYKVGKEILGKYNIEL